MKLLLSCCLVFTILYSCNENKSTESNKAGTSVITVNSSSPDESRVIMDSLATKAISQGDTLAYRELSRLFIMVKLRKNDLYYYAYRMAVKHDCAQAYWDMFFILSGPIHTGESYKDMDECTRKMAVYYLLLAYEKGDRNASYAVSDYFEKGKVPSSKNYKTDFCF